MSEQYRRWWMAPDTTVHAVPPGKTHAEARPEASFAEGWLRLIQDGDTLVSHNDHRLPTDRQRSALKAHAAENGMSHVVHDYKTKILRLAREDLDFSIEAMNPEGTEPLTTRGDPHRWTHGRPPPPALPPGWRFDPRRHLEWWYFLNEAAHRQESGNFDTTLPKVMAEWLDEHAPSDDPRSLLLRHVTHAEPTTGGYTASSWPKITTVFEPSKDPSRFVGWADAMFWPEARHSSYVESHKAPGTFIRLLSHRKTPDAPHSPTLWWHHTIPASRSNGRGRQEADFTAPIDNETLHQYISLMPHSRTRARWQAAANRLFPRPPVRLTRFTSEGGFADDNRPLNEEDFNRWLAGVPEGELNPPPRSERSPDRFPYAPTLPTVVSEWLNTIQRPPRPLTPLRPPDSRFPGDVALSATKEAIRHSIHSHMPPPVHMLRDLYVAARQAAETNPPEAITHHQEAAALLGQVIRHLEATTSGLQSLAAFRYGQELPEPPANATALAVAREAHRAHRQAINQRGPQRLSRPLPPSVVAREATLKALAAERLAVGADAEGQQAADAINRTRQKIITRARVYAARALRHLVGEPVSDSVESHDRAAQAHQALGRTAVDWPLKDAHQAAQTAHREAARFLIEPPARLARPTGEGGVSPEDREKMDPRVGSHFAGGPVDEEELSRRLAALSNGEPPTAEHIAVGLSTEAKDATEKARYADYHMGDAGYSGLISPAFEAAWGAGRCMWPTALLNHHITLKNHIARASEVEPPLQDLHLAAAEAHRTAIRHIRENLWRHAEGEPPEGWLRLARRAENPQYNLHAHSLGTPMLRAHHAGQTPASILADAVGDITGDPEDPRAVIARLHDQQGLKIEHQAHGSWLHHGKDLYEHPTVAGEYGSCTTAIRGPVAYAKSASGPVAIWSLPHANASFAKQVPYVMWGIPGPQRKSFSFGGTGGRGPDQMLSPSAHRRGLSYDERLNLLTPGLSGAQRRRIERMPPERRAAGRYSRVLHAILTPEQARQMASKLLPKDRESWEQWIAANEHRWEKPARMARLTGEGGFTGDPEESLADENELNRRIEALRGAGPERPTDEQMATVVRSDRSRIASDRANRERQIAAERRRAKLALPARRHIRAAANAPSHLPVSLIEGAAAPQVVGEDGGFFTRGGTLIHRPSAYRRVGWSNMSYRPSSRRVEVGREWVRRNVPNPHHILGEEPPARLYRPGDPLAGSWAELATRATRRAHAATQAVGARGPIAAHPALAQAAEHIPDARTHERMIAAHSGMQTWHANRGHADAARLHGLAAEVHRRALAETPQRMARRKPKVNAEGILNIRTRAKASLNETENEDLNARLKALGMEEAPRMGPESVPLVEDARRKVFDMARMTFRTPIEKARLADPGVKALWRDVLLHAHSAARAAKAGDYKTAREHIGPLFETLEKAHISRHAFSKHVVPFLTSAYEATQKIAGL